MYSLHTGGIYFPWKSFLALDLESFLHLPHSVLCKWLSAIWSFFHTVSCHSANHLATQFTDKRNIIYWELTYLFAYSHYTCIFLLPYTALLKNFFIQLLLLLHLFKWGLLLLLVLWSWSLLLAVLRHDLFCLYVLPLIPGTVPFFLETFLDYLQCCILKCPSTLQP